jgi:hypothetical protein
MRDRSRVMQKEIYAGENEWNYGKAYFRGHGGFIYPYLRELTGITIAPTQST